MLCAASGSMLFVYTYNVLASSGAVGGERGGDSVVTDVRMNV